MVIIFAMQDSLVFCELSFEIARYMRFVSIKSVRILDLVVVNVPVRIRKKWVWNFVHMNKIKHSLAVFFHIALVSVRTLSSLCSFVFSVVFFGFKTTPFKWLNFLSKLRLSQLRVYFPICLKFKLNAVFIKRYSGVMFLFLER